MLGLSALSRFYLQRGFPVPSTKVESLTGLVDRGDVCKAFFFTTTSMPLFAAGPCEPKRWCRPQSESRPKHMEWIYPEGSMVRRNSSMILLAKRSQSRLIPSSLSMLRNAVSSSTISTSICGNGIAAHLIARSSNRGIGLWGSAALK